MDVKSFNRLLSDVTTIIKTNTDKQAVIYIPKSIQRILENNKEAFVKQTDLEITEDEIKQVLEEQDYKSEKITRLVNKVSRPLKAIKITFTNGYNRDLFVKLGLQIDSLQNQQSTTINPHNVLNVSNFGHIAKYCKGEKQICSQCAVEDYTYVNCTHRNERPLCRNCKGEHNATFTECSK